MRVSAGAAEREGDSRQNGIFSERNRSKRSLVAERTS